MAVDGVGATGEALPLDGVVVLDFSQFLAGPSCALRLADLGATVTKVERPDGGDACRDLDLAGQRRDGSSALFHFINRNKDSQVADLKDAGDLARVRALIGCADVLVHNLRPGIMDRLGLGYEAVAALNPRLVYAGVSGYGPDGPWAHKPGQDLLVQALSGMAWASGDGDGPPVPAGLPVTDLMAGAQLAQGILALLVRRGTTGRGGRVDVSLLEAAIDLQFENFSTWLNGAPTPDRSRVAGANAYLGAPYGLYRTADGHIALAMMPVDRLGALIDCPVVAGWPADRWFADRDAIKAALRDHLRGQVTDHWLGLLEPAGLWCAPVLDWGTLTAHPAFGALDAVQSVALGDGTALRTTRCPIRIDGRILASDRAAPRLGAGHTALNAARERTP